MKVPKKKTRETKNKYNSIATVLITIIVTLIIVFALSFVPGLDYFKYYASGYSIKRSAKTSPARTVLWEQPKLITGRINEVHGNNDATISPDGKTIVLTRSYSVHNKDLYISYLIEDEWSKPKPLNKVNTEYNESTPEIAAEGNLLLFASDRPGGAGGYDIWYSRKTGINTWSTPEIINNDDINTKYNELYPYLNEDKISFYLSSDRPTSTTDIPKKDYDIFTANTAETNLNNKVNIDYSDFFNSFTGIKSIKKLNSPYNEGRVALTERGNLIYFSSDRPGGIGGYDLYKSYIIEDQYTEPYNFGKPVNTEDDEISPSLSLEGFGLFFCSNYNSRNPRNFYVYTTVSREVLAKIDYSIFTNLILIIIFILLTIFVLWIILRLLLYKNNMKMIVKCLLIALLLHLLFAYLSAFWFFTKQLSQNKPKTPEEMTININTLARESIATSIREGTASLPKVKSSSSSEQPVEKITIPAQKPTVQSNTSVSWKASIIKPTNTPVSMTKSESVSEIKSTVMVEDSTSSIKPAISGSPNITLESPEGMGENEAAKTKGKSKGLPNPTDPPSFKQNKKVFVKEKSKTKNKMELKDIEVADISIALIKPEMDMSQRNSQIMSPKTLNNATGKNTGSQIENEDVSQIIGLDSLDAGWPSEAGSLFIQNNFAMVIPESSKALTQQKLGLLKKDNYMTKYNSIHLKNQQTQILINKLIFEKEILKNIYRFINFNVIEKPFTDTAFSERIGETIYSATPNFIIVTDSELEVPEKYLEDK